MHKYNVEKYDQWLLIWWDEEDSFSVIKRGNKIVEYEENKVRVGKDEGQIYV